MSRRPSTVTPLPRWGIRSHRLWRWLGSAALLLVIAAVSLHFVRSATLALTSDPACYLNYAKTLAAGRLFFDYPAARVVFDLGGHFPDSVFHGYAFATPDQHLYPFVGIGFPLWLAGIIALFGLPSATAANIALLPLFLVVYAWLLRRARATATTWSQTYVPLLALIWLFCQFEAFLGSWVMPYRELPAMTMALAALLPVASQRPKRPWLWAAAGGLLMGIACTIRETAAFMLPSLVVLCCLGEPGPLLRRMPRQAALIAIIGLMAAVGFSPQLYVNKVQRGSMLGAQAEHLLARITHAKTLEHAADAASLAGESTGRDEAHPGNKRAAGFGRALSGRLLYLRQTGGGWMLLAAAAGLGVAMFKRERRFLAVTILPAIAYTLAHSALIPAGRGYAQRYELTIFLFLVPLAARGVVEVLEWLRPSRHAIIRRVVDAAIVGALLTLLLLMTPAAEGQKDRLTSVRDLEAFQRDVDQCVPAGAIVLADAPARDYLQYLSRGNAVSLYSMLEASHKDPGTVLAACHRSSHRVFFLDAPNRFMASVPYSSAETEHRLRAEADLVPVHGFKLDRYHLEPEFHAATACLYEVLPPTNTAMNVTLPAPFTGAARLEIPVGTRPTGDTVTVTLNGIPAAARLLGSDTAVVEAPSIHDSVTVRVTSSAPFPRSAGEPRLLPAAAATTVPFGRGGRELGILGTNWISREPTLLHGGRCLPGLSALNIPAFRDCWPGRLDVHVGIYPVKPAKVNVTIRRQSAPLKPLPCLDRNGSVNGLLIEDWPADEPLFLDNASSTPILVHALAVGKASETVNLPALNADEPPVFWKALHIPADGATPARETLIVERAADLPVIPGEADLVTLSPGTGGGVLARSAGGGRLLLLEPLDCRGMVWRLPGDDIRRNATVESHICAGGFYPVESQGKWTRAESRVLLPPDVWRNPLELALDVVDHRPTNMPPTRVEFRIGDRVIHEESIPAKGALHRVTCRVPVVTEPAGLPYLRITSSVWQPRHHIRGNEDSRDLGIQIRAISMKPCNDAP